MNKVIAKETRIPIKLWLDDMEEGALEQAKNLANLPFAFHHVAIMPDAHFGFGMPIGGVLATESVVIPNAVGKDIGCGMCAVKTSLSEIDKDTLKKIMCEIRKVIPLGFNHHKDKQDAKLMPHIPVHCELPIVEREYQKALYSLGSLGSGNHFCEIQRGNDGCIWIMLHSGSRNLGLQVADHYNKLAVEFNEQWHSLVPKEHQLAFLPLDSSIGQAYLAEMNYCVEYALANRKLMMERIVNIIRCVLLEKREIPLQFEPMINIAHNYATMENHFGKNVMVHRKGATLARTDTIGIIPGSQGTKSYIVRGKGNLESFMSCSHGAGRAMSRTKAIATLSLEAETKLLDDQGIIHGIRNQKDLDEAAGSYKDITTVMKNQQDLVEILVELTPLAVIKG